MSDVTIDYTGLFDNVQISEESIHGQLLCDTGPYFIDTDDLSILGINIAGHCRASDFDVSTGKSSEPSELDIYLNQGAQKTSPSVSLAAPEIQPRLPIIHINSSTKTVPQEAILPFSGSVDIGKVTISMREPQKIELVHDLEEFYRPRYKSDYFGQNGKIRKPRYVTDRLGNHYISLRVPPNTNGFIRIDWLTIETEDGQRFRMPYHFQASNEDQNVKDCNPMYLPIETNKENVMQIYLVLIKAKQDQLKSVKFLEPFQPLREAFYQIDSSAEKPTLHLNPKELIRRYQLEKSQLAFTFSLRSKDGNGFVDQWDTTVYSTVLTETAVETNREKKVQCPNCSHEFTTNDSVNEEESTAEESSNAPRKKRLPSETSAQRRSTLKKQRSDDTTTICLE